MTQPRARQVALSKAVAHALRHDPQRYGIEVDRNGWTAVDDLVAGLRRASPRWRGLTRAELEEMIGAADKQRFLLTGERVSARYGHSLAVRAAGEPEPPPARLFHGTTPAAAPRILEEGLRPMRRQYVHLSVDGPTAVHVARRRTPSPVLLRIAAAEAAAAGTSFWRGTAAVWLAERIDPAFLTRIDASRRGDET